MQALRERTEQLSLRSGACAVQLERAQSLLAQFAEAHQELSPWLEETQGLGVQLSPNAISYEAFKEQQALLQVRTPRGVGSGEAVADGGGTGAVPAARVGTIHRERSRGESTGSARRQQRGTSPCTPSCRRAPPQPSPPSLPRSACGRPSPSTVP